MYLFAPVAVVVPLTIATAVGATTIVGERERVPASSWPTRPPASSEIYLGKLIASLLPGYLTTVVGFGLYSLIVNLVVGPKVGGWFFPTSSWWVLMIWVVPPFLALDARDRGALLGAGEVERRRPAGGGPGEPPDDHHRLQPVDRRPVRRHRDGLHRRFARVDRRARSASVAACDR